MLTKLLKAIGFRYVYRSSVTGKFVSAAYARAHPETTYKARL